MDKIRIVPGAGYTGEGNSQGLARGLLVYYGDRNITGEGMGIGSIALRDQEYTYFSRSWTDSEEDGVLKRTFTLDTRMMWGIRGKPSSFLTRWIEIGISAYMQLPRLQGIIILPVFPLRTLLGIHPLFETIPPRGKVTFTYRITGHHVEVHVEIHVPVGPTGYPLPVKRAQCCLVHGRMGRETTRQLLLPDGKRSAWTSCPFPLLIRCMGSGSLWTSHQSALLCRSPSSVGGNIPEISAGRVFASNWVPSRVHRDYPK